MRPLRLLLIFSVFILMVSCTVQVSLRKQGPPEKQEYPEDEVLTLPVLLERLRGIAEIKGSASVEIKTTEKNLSGDAVIRITPNDFEVRMYSMGFPAAQFSLIDGIFYSNPKFKGEEERTMVNCIMEGIFWWRAKNMKATDTGSEIYLKRPGQIVVLDNDTFKPIEHAMALPMGESLHIAYKKVKKIDGVWFPMKLEATSERYNLTIEFDKVELKMGYIAPQQEEPQTPPRAEEPLLEDESPPDKKLPADEEPLDIKPEKISDADGSISGENTNVIKENDLPELIEEPQEKGITITDKYEKITEGQPIEEGPMHYTEEINNEAIGLEYISEEDINIPDKDKQR
ncbi:MAG: hypothetical protein HQL01_10770 [Nitrospirae bacterium]|nr:hypothetical protein [Nitrospirota bacterium]